MNRISKAHRVCLGVAVLCFFGMSRPAQAQVIPNGKIDGLEELVTTKEYSIVMKDGVRLASDVSLPILQDDLGFEEIPINFGPINITLPYVKIASKGLQFMQYPGQADPFRLPVVFTRTPYGKGDPIQGQIVSILGYCNVLQDMRGRYNSEGTYYPMYSDSWEKTPYLGNIAHPLDTTQNHAANKHEDGIESLDFITHQLRWDTNGDGTLDENDRLVCNGTIGMFGASALANTQYQAASVKKIDTSKPGLKCMVPIVGSCEFYHSTGHHNGVFRERIIDGWLRGQVERYNYKNEPDNSVLNDIHTLGDFGPNIKYPKDAAETAIDFWTTMHRAHYPNSGFRSILDVSHAMLNEKGESDPNGKISRYTNLDLPIYNLTGWYDIFVDGQIETWQNLTKHISPQNKKFQKLVIGPWAHQTIGSRVSGDMRETPQGDFRYKENVGAVIGATLDNISPENIGDVAKSELIDWFRTFMGAPMIIIPPQTEYQKIGEVMGFQASLLIPADTLKLAFEDFFNFINGTGGISIKIKVQGVPIIPENEVLEIPVPATGVSLIGDRSGIKLEKGKYKNFDASAPDGVPNVRFYVPGPIADGITENDKAGNYWYQTDTFPLRNIPRQKLYLHGDHSFSEKAPTAEETPRVFLADPDSPVPTHGGPNMIVNTPDDRRASQGQMNFTDPMYSDLVLNRRKQLINGDSIPDLVSFTSPELSDTFSVAGFPTATLYAKAKPLSQTASDSTNCDFIVRVLDVYPDGRELYVFEGAVNARARDYARTWAEGGENPEVPFSNIASDKIYEYKFRMLPIAYTWGKGHKIKVLISGTNYPRYQACPNVPLQDGDFFRRRPYEEKSYNYNGKELFPRKSIQTLHFAQDMPAHIEFPVLGKQLVTGIEPQNGISMSETFRVYPNPANDLVAVSCESNRAFKVQLLNLMGQEILNGEVTRNVYNLDVRDLPSNVYIIRITSEDGAQVINKKLVIQR